MSEPKFVEFKTEDGLTLPGLFYEAGEHKKVAIYLHGNGSSSVFYDESKNRDLPEALNKSGISILKFNNRGAHIIKKLSVDSIEVNDDRKPYGCAYEIIKECVLDIDGALDYVRKLGYEEFYLIGKSTGANKICVYNHYKPQNEFSKYAIVCGGDDTGSYYDILGDKLFFKLLNEAKQKIGAGKGEDIMKELIDVGELFSYKGFYDIANPDGDYNSFPFLEALGRAKISTKPLFRFYKEINKPSVVIYGEVDEFAWGEVPKLVKILESLRPDLKYKIISGVDHRFSGKEKELASEISDFLK